MALNAFAKTLIANFPLGFVATVTPAGLPAVSPKGTFLVLDDTTIAFGDIRSPGTTANLALNPGVEVNFIDPFLRKGLRVRGIARVLPKGDEDFETLWPQWQTTWGDLADRMGAIVTIAIRAAKPLTTPPYDDGVTEEQMVALYKDKFGKIYP